MTEQGVQHRGQHDRAQRASQRFVGARIRGKLVLPDRFPGQVGEYIVRFNTEHNGQDQRPVVNIVGHVPKMTKADAEQKESPRTQRHTLDVTFRAIGKNRDGGNDTDTQGPQGHEEPVPVVRDGECDEQHADDHNPADCLLTEEPHSSCIFAVTQQTEQRHGRNGGRSAQQYRPEHQWHQHQPRAIPLPKLITARCLGLSPPEDELHNQWRCRQRTDHANRNSHRHRVIKGIPDAE